jgi:hypothetical protein
MTIWLVGWGEYLWSLPALNPEGMTWVRLWTDAMHFATREQAARVAGSILPSDDPRVAKVLRMEVP